MNFFDQFPEFIQLDPRKDREFLRVTTETMTNRCEVMLPEELIKGKRILDIGSALGAMGHWGLSHGAEHYTGVEIQNGYRSQSNVTLRKYWDNFSIVHNIDDIQDQYDIVIAAGVIHGVLDLVSMLNKICSKTSSYLIVESRLIEGDSPSISLIPNGDMINYNDVNIPFTGVQLVPNLAAVSLLLKCNNFDHDCDLYPKPFTMVRDPYNTRTGFDRFICRYKRSDTRLTTLEEAINVGI